ncbi:TetR/AcrR family transcriptional regulator [Pseudonocardia pini]|uniref:TetR/AcrR family transcriptional regulator n=1 Tax=Pseudonocardia pini TaxID=2758030 RepID=UPI0015F00FD5|nr:TetR/AcrR family transcriptional regulator [Pseudonocardia pini]
MSREQQILDAAEKLFAERSFDGVGVDAIGREAGVTGSAIYRHFDGKDEILAALFDEATDALLLSVGEPGGDPWEELSRLVKAHVEFSVGRRRLSVIWQREQRALSGAHERSFRRRQRRYIDRWVDCLDRCYPGHARDTLVAAIRAVHALMFSDSARPDGVREPTALPALLTGLTVAALDGLAAPGAARLRAVDRAG